MRVSPRLLIASLASCGLAAGHVYITDLVAEDPDESGEDFDESVFAFRRSETDELRERFQFVPGVGATTSRRAAAAAVAKTAMDLVSSNERAGREKGAAIRF